MWLGEDRLGCSGKKATVIQESCNYFCKLSVGSFISTEQNSHPSLEKEVFCKTVIPVEFLGSSSAEKILTQHFGHTLPFRCKDAQWVLNQKLSGRQGLLLGITPRRFLMVLISFFHHGSIHHGHSCHVNSIKMSLTVCHSFVLELSATHCCP